MSHAGQPQLQQPSTGSTGRTSSSTQTGAPQPSTLPPETPSNLTASSQSQQPQQRQSQATSEEAVDSSSDVPSSGDNGRQGQQQQPQPLNPSNVDVNRNESKQWQRMGTDSEQGRQSTENADNEGISAQEQLSASEDEDAADKATLQIPDDAEDKTSRMLQSSGMAAKVIPSQKGQTTGPDFAQSRPAESKHCHFFEFKDHRSGSACKDLWTVMSIDSVYVLMQSSKAYYESNLAALLWLLTYAGSGSPHQRVCGPHGAPCVLDVSVMACVANKSGKAVL